GEMRREGVRQAQGRRQLGAVETRTQHPYRHFASRAWNGAYGLTELRLVQISDQLQYVLREMIDIAAEITPQRHRSAAIGARGAAHAQIDAARVKRGQGDELLGDHQR